MIDYIIPLISSFFNSGMALYFLFPLIGLAFIATVPIIVRSFLKRG